LSSTPNLYLHPTNVGLIANWGMAMILNLILPEKLAMLTAEEGKVLMTTQEVKDIMQGMDEVFAKIEGKVVCTLIWTSSFLSLPWFGASYNDCNKVTYKAYNDWVADKDNNEKPPDCEPSGAAAGMPTFGLILFYTTACNFFLEFRIWSLWKPLDGAKGESNPDDVPTAEKSS